MEAVLHKHEGLKVAAGRFHEVAEWCKVLVRYAEWMLLHNFDASAPGTSEDIVDFQAFVQSDLTKRFATTEFVSSCCDPFTKWQSARSTATISVSVKSLDDAMSCLRAEKALSNDPIADTAAIETAVAGFVSVFDASEKKLGKVEKAQGDAIKTFLHRLVQLRLHLVSQMFINVS